jgi:hypothetical protein
MEVAAEPSRVDLHGAAIPVRTAPVTKRLPPCVRDVTVDGYSSPSSGSFTLKSASRNSSYGLSDDVMV